jgi:hypothetical protein
MGDKIGNALWMHGREEKCVLRYGKQVWKVEVFLISNFRRVPNVARFILGNSPASEVYIPTFRNTLSVPSSQAGRRV